MSNFTALMPALDLQGEVRVLLLQAGMSNTQSLQVSSQILDLMMASAVAAPNVKEAYAAHCAAQ